GPPADRAVIISGPDLTVLRDRAEETLRMLLEVPGAADTFIEQEGEQAQLRITVDRQQVARYGINVRDVEDVIEMAIGGRPAGTKFVGERGLGITARHVPEGPTPPPAPGAITVHPPRPGAAA